MNILGQMIEFHFETPVDEQSRCDLLFGINLMNGNCQCGEPAVAVQLGFILFTFTITITKAH